MSTSRVVFVWFYPTYFLLGDSWWTLVVDSAIVSIRSLLWISFWGTVLPTGQSRNVNSFLQELYRKEGVLKLIHEMGLEDRVTSFTESLGGKMIGMPNTSGKAHSSPPTVNLCCSSITALVLTLLKINIAAKQTQTWKRVSWQRLRWKSVSVRLRIIYKLLTRREFTCQNYLIWSRTRALYISDEKCPSLYLWGKSAFLVESGSSARSGC